MHITLQPNCIIQLKTAEKAHSKLSDSSELFCGAMGVIEWSQLLVVAAAGDSCVVGPSPEGRALVRTPLEGRGCLGCPGEREVLSAHCPLSGSFVYSVCVRAPVRKCVCVCVRVCV